MAAAMRRHWWYRGRRVAVRSLLARAGMSAGDARILDYGCGTGGMGAALARFGTVSGIEAERGVLDVGDYAAYDEVVCADSLAGAGLRASAFDLVTCLDVLEHVDDDVGLLRELVVALRPDGLLVVSVPLRPDLFCAVDEIAGHVRRYTPQGLRESLRQAGLAPVAASCYIVALLPAARWQRRRVQRGRSRPEVEWKVPAAPVNAALASVAVAEGVLARWFALPPGLSLIVVARRGSTAAEAL